MGNSEVPEQEGVQVDSGEDLGLCYGILGRAQGSGALLWIRCFGAARVILLLGIFVSYL